MEASQVALITSLITSATTLGGIFLNEKLKKLKTPDLGDPDFEDLIGDIIDNISKELNANRVMFWEGKNGTNTLSGYHLKTLNLMLESNAPGSYDVKEELQDVPVIAFKRNIKQLSGSEDGIIVSKEYEIQDELSALHKSYQNETVVCLKITTKANKWTSILMVGFKGYREISNEECAWLKLQAGRIGVILKKY